MSLCVSLLAVCVANLKLPLICLYGKRTTGKTAEGCRQHSLSLPPLSPPLFTISSSATPSYLQHSLPLAKIIICTASRCCCCLRCCCFFFFAFIISLSSSAHFAVVVVAVVPLFICALRCCPLLCCYISTSSTLPRPRPRISPLKPLSPASLLG